MAVKPTADDGVELVVGATTVVAVLALGSMVLRIDRRDGVAPRGSRAAVGG
jgi:hypothetical protein